MAAQHESPAVAIARAHVEAWSNHDFDTARNGLAPDVRVTATTTTQPTPPATDLTGADDYMVGLTQFAQAVVPGSQRILASVGDEHNALLMLTVQVDLGAGRATLPGARLYLLDEHDKIKTEHVIFYAAQG
jgi:SnoaL-like domain